MSIIQTKKNISLFISTSEEILLMKQIVNKINEKRFKLKLGAMKSNFKDDL